MKIRYIKLSQWLFTSILAFIGFSSCKDNGGGSVEYGTPYATHIIKAKVVDKEHNVIPDIKVVVTDSYRRIDSAFTNQYGMVSFSSTGFPGQEYIIESNNINGTEKSSCQTVFTIVSFKNAKYTAGKGWYSGEAEKEVEITMKDTEAEN